MAVFAEPNFLTPDQYLVMERASSDKHELWRGEVFAMAGASYIHNCIVANLLRRLGEVLEGGPCRPLPSDMKIHIPSRESFVYPDASIVCGRPEFLDHVRDVLTNPAAVIEVLSEGTERFDRGEKFVGYRSIPSLRECMLISQHEPRIEHYIRQPAGTWILHEYTADDSLQLAVGGMISLAHIYEDTNI